MIENVSWFWFSAGLFAGFVHATMLWRAVQTPTAWSPLLGLLRLGIVASLLVVAALSGAILAGAAGWALGLAVLCMWFMSRRKSSSKTLAT